MDVKVLLTKFHYKKNYTPAEAVGGAFLYALLAFPSFVYLLTVKVRNFLYRKRILKSFRPHQYTISVGNLTTGGTGKTPITAEIANYFVKKGEYPAILSRGYGGELSNKNVNVISDGEKINYTSKQSGDEPFWLAQHCKGAAVLTCSNRAKAAQFAKNELHCTKLILDDGYQHQKLERDLNILVVDSEKQFSNGCVLPLGALREPVSEIKRADRIIVVNKNFNDKKAKTFARYLRKKYSKPSFVCTMEPDEIYNIITGEPLDDAKAVQLYVASGVIEGNALNTLVAEAIQNTVTSYVHTVRSDAEHIQKPGHSWWHPDFDRVDGNNGIYDHSYTVSVSTSAKTVAGVESTFVAVQVVRSSVRS